MSSPEPACWLDLQRDEPAIAKIGLMLMGSTGRAMLATVRPDGGPRVHPLCPVVCGGKLVIGVITRSPKFRDLLRDDRCVLHALPGPGDLEFWVEGRARPMEPCEADRMAAEDSLLDAPPGNALFEIHPVRVFATIFESGEDGVPVPDRRVWRAEPRENR